jgi:DNA-directed RNA polymerase specialized sigma subunit
LKYLGESKLSYLNVVYARSSMKASAHERGAIVQRLLISLAKGLKPITSERETSAGRLYAILNYCYFDKGLTNAQIAAHLSISERQFYRDRKQAIQDLLNRLLELEASPEKWSEV